MQLADLEYYPGLRLSFDFSIEAHQYFKESGRQKRALENKKSERKADLIYGKELAAKEERETYYLPVNCDQASLYRPTVSSFSNSQIHLLIG